ncbi:MAG: DUF2179 domain-containing protein [Desulfobacteraceae bacterium]
MELGFSWATLATGILVFLSRVVDVSLGTLRTISTVQGRSKIAFVLGLLEVSIWLVVITTVVNQIMNEPVLGIFYALGFSTGNVVGINIEKRLAFGFIILRVITKGTGKRMANEIRDAGYGVTTFEGEGKFGPVTELYIVTRRRQLPAILQQVKAIQPDAFYITEQAGSVSKIYRPFLTQATGWRAILKRK